MTYDNRPIGIFDSGIGGLTVAHAIHKLLPNESFIYFGDTAHLPYGEKSPAAIQSYTVKISDFLLKHECKAILIACNSASATAFDLAREYNGSKAKVMNVIDPVVNHVTNLFSESKIGLIGTRATVLSEVYHQKLQKSAPHIQLKSLATPLLVPVIEEGFFNNSISHSVIEEYLSNPMFQDISSIILGCTHYPLIKQEVRNYFEGKVNVIDSSAIVAKELKQNLKLWGQEHENNNNSFKKFYVSDLTGYFDASAKIFFKDEVNLEYYRLWE